MSSPLRTAGLILFVAAACTAAGAPRASAQVIDPPGQTVYTFNTAGEVVNTGLTWAGPSAQ